MSGKNGINGMLVAFSVMNVARELDRRKKRFCLWVGNANGEPFFLVNNVPASCLGLAESMAKTGALKAIGGRANLSLLDSLAAKEGERWVFGGAIPKGYSAGKEVPYVIGFYIQEMGNQEVLDFIAEYQL